MSIDIKDHRKFVEGKLRDTDMLEAEKPVKLMEQSPITSSTGDDRLDKMLRGIQALKEKAEERSKVVALTGIGCIQEEAVRLQQFEFFYNKGRSDACSEMALFPAQILLESKTHTPEGTA